MFELSKNDFINTGVCNYIDEHGNKLFIRREDRGFLVRLNFAQKDVKMDEVRINVPDTELSEKGLVINITPAGKEKDAEINDGIQNMRDIIVRWYNMLMDINILGMNDRWLANYMESEGIAPNEKTIKAFKCEPLMEYPELESAMNIMRGKRAPISKKKKGGNNAIR